MEPRISVRHETVSEGTKEYIAESCSKLEKFYDGIIDCEVIVDKSKHGFTAEFIVKVPQQRLAAKGEGENLYKAVADAESKVEVQLKKYHDKQVAH
jgi:putative sigma-54 modulation protein